MNSPSVLSQPDPVIAACETHNAAHAAVKALTYAGFDLTKLSMVGRGLDFDEHSMGFYTSDDGVHAWGTASGLVGASWGLMGAPALFDIPDVGLVAAAGKFGPSLDTALQLSTLLDGTSALVNALVGLGVPKHEAIAHEDEIKADRFLLIVHSGPADVARARLVLANMSPVAAHEAQAACAAEDAPGRAGIAQTSLR